MADSIRDSIRTKKTIRRSLVKPQFNQSINITMPDWQTGDMRQIQEMMSALSLWHQLALASCEFYVYTIFQIDIYVKISFIFIFFLQFSNMILSDALILPVSQLQTQQVMTSRIRSHLEYLIHTYILALILQSKLMKNLALMVGFNTI